MGFLFFIALVGFVLWNSPENRMKIKKWLSMHPDVLYFFRVPNLYITIFVVILLYSLGGFFLVLVGIRGARRLTTHPEIKQRLDDFLGTFTSPKGVTKVKNTASAKNTSTSSVSGSFIPSPSSMDIVALLKRVFYWIIAGVVVLIVLSQGLPRYTVSPGEIALITRLGKLQENYATEGLNFKYPLIDKVVRVNIQTQKTEATANAASKDLQNISATIAVNGNVLPTFAKELYRNLGDASLVSDKIINPSIQESVKAATAKYTAEELITKRTAVSQDIRVLLVEKLERRGIQVTDVNIVNFQFSADFDAAIEKKVKAEQEALAEKNKLESVKFQAQQSIERSKAEAESIRIQAEAIKSQGGQEYVNLKWIEKWDGKLPQTSLGSSNGLILNLKQ